MKTDVLIVGQGLAGSFLAHFLRQAGLQVLIIDEQRKGSASAEAAGLINPITGRRYVKSWRIDELIPFAKEAYQVQEDSLGISCFHNRSIFRAFFSAKESNDWWARASDPGFEHYFASESDSGPFERTCRPVHSYGAVRKSAQVDVRLFLEAFAAKAAREGWLLQERFVYADLECTPQAVHYRDIKADYVVFCEGFGLRGNPFFQGLPMEGAKGEVLIVRIPGFPMDAVLKHKIFIAPLGRELCWVGATYERVFQHSGPSPEQAVFLENQLREILMLSYEVVGHRAAVRPTVRDRRPLLGFHSTYPRLVIFNGLGTKGASLAPFWAHHLVQVLVGNTSLDPEVDINRFIRA